MLLQLRQRDRAVAVLVDDREDGVGVRVDLRVRVRVRVRVTARVRATARVRDWVRVSEGEEPAA